MAVTKPVLNPTGTHVYTHNPTTDGDWECPVDYLPVALARGFELADAPAEDLGDLFDAPAPVVKKPEDSRTATAAGQNTPPAAPAATA